MNFFIFVKFAAACGTLFNVTFCKTNSFYSFNSVLNKLPCFTMAVCLQRYIIEKSQKHLRL